MPKIQSFVLNGHKYFTNYPITISEIVEYFNYNSSLFVLEYNSFICAKQNWNYIQVKNNDKIEIVTIVGGG